MNRLAARTWMAFVLFALSAQAAPLQAPTEAVMDDPVTTELTYTDAVVFGVVEGLTEYLPISSTGHLIIAKEFLGLESGEEAPTAEIVKSEAIDAYLIVIQAGAIVAVLVIYWRRVWSVILGLLGRDPAGLRLGINLIVAFMPAVVFGLLLEEWIETNLFSVAAVVGALVVGGVFMLLVEWWRKRTEIEGRELEALDWKGALVIGFAQCVALWPGTSRSMMTIVGGYWAGLKPKEAAEFSFLLGLITLTAASFYKGLKGGTEMVEALGVGQILVGLIVAFVVAVASVKFLVGWLSKHGLGLFAWYRIVAGAVLAWLTFG